MARTQILVVEDDSMVAGTIEATLQSLEYTVPAIASSGTDAIKKVEDVQPDLVLMDIRLKGDMDGIQATEQIRTHFDIPVVYVTGYADEETLQRAKVTEPYGYILKPFQDRELHTAIEMALYKHKMEGENVRLKREISQRKQAEEELETSMANLGKIVENNSDGIVIIDRKGVTRLVNPAAQALFGRNAEELLGTQFGFPLAGGETTEIDIMQKGGKTAVAEMRVVETEWEGETAYLASLRDITERKQAQQAQEKLSQQLQAQVSELETFSYGIAHDLRSPLLSIEGFSRELRADIQNKKVERVQEDIKLLESGVRKMQHFLNRTLEYSRAGYQVKPTKNVPFGKIVEEVVIEFAEQVRSIGATVAFAGTFPRVYADRMRIKQVLTNLIQNSINYRDKTRPLKIDIGYWLSGDEVVFFVRDNGIGIDTSEMENVFALFYRGTADGEGSGAGLAIVKRIIEAHGGRVWVQDQCAEGTTMCFTLPQNSGVDDGE